MLRRFVLVSVLFASEAITRAVIYSTPRFDRYTKEVRPAKSNESAVVVAAAAVRVYVHHRAGT